ncbi:MAG: hypothetical protein R3B74_05415 [Nitrospirales bacterium]|nr:hypothetical protein [Nitrospirales bacterium]
MKNVSPLAGQPTKPSMLANIPRLVTAYYTGRPDPSIRAPWPLAHRDIAGPH